MVQQSKGQTMDGSRSDVQQQLFPEYGKTGSALSGWNWNRGNCACCLMDADRIFLNGFCPSEAAD